MDRIAVLLSGGVDSAVVVHKLCQEGYRPELFYIRIGKEDGSDGCSAEEDIEMCTLISKKYGLPFHVVSLHDEYWEFVIKYVLESVQKGLTPHPDMMCNKIIKFGFFEERYGHEFDLTATGHYARKLKIGDDYYLAPGVDPVKDQTDFLSAISYPQLAHALFPIGDLDKHEVRDLAKEANLPNAGRKDSQGICFLGKINYRDFIREKLGIRKGPVVDMENGKILGEHDGFWLYTIGQRKGLGLSGGPWFVISKDPETNTLYVSKGYDTPMQYSDRIFMDIPHWITRDPFKENIPGIDLKTGETGEEIEVKFKNRHAPEFNTGILHKEGSFYRIDSEQNIQGVAPGQYVTIYTPDRKLCLGSAMITN